MTSRQPLRAYTIVATRSLTTACRWRGQGSMIDRSCRTQECGEIVGVSLSVACIAYGRCHHVPSWFTQCCSPVMASPARTRYGRIGRMGINSPQPGSVASRIGVARIACCRSNDMCRWLAQRCHIVVTSPAGTCYDSDVVECGTVEGCKVTGIGGGVASIAL